MSLNPAQAEATERRAHNAGEEESSFASIFSSFAFEKVRADSESSDGSVRISEGSDVQCSNGSSRIRYVPNRVAWTGTLSGAVGHTSCGSARGRGG